MRRNKPENADAPLKARAQTRSLAVTLGSAEGLQPGKHKRHVGKDEAPWCQKEGCRDGGNGSFVGPPPGTACGRRAILLVLTPPLTWPHTKPHWPMGLAAPPPTPSGPAHSATHCTRPVGGQPLRSAPFMGLRFIDRKQPSASWGPRVGEAFGGEPVVPA